MTLLKELKQIFDTNCSYYENKKDIVRGYYNNEFSCNSGCVNGLIYYYQTEKLFEDHPIETLELIQEIQEETGMLQDLLIGGIKDNIDCIIWAIFEHYTYNWINEIEYEIEQEEREVI